MSGLFKKIKNAYHLFKAIDLEQLNHLSQKIDLAEVMKNVGKLNDEQLTGLMKMLSTNKKSTITPFTDGDFYDISHTLNPEELALQLKVREIGRAHV